MIRRRRSDERLFYWDFHARKSADIPACGSAGRAGAHASLRPASTTGRALAALMQAAHLAGHPSSWQRANYA